MNNGGTERTYEQFADRIRKHQMRRATKLQEPPSCRSWYWRSSAGELAPYRCNTWSCPRCAPLLADRWASIIAAAEPQRHIVITALPPEPHDAARSIMRALVKAIRRGQALRVGQRENRIEFEYFCTMETSRSGLIHAHLLQRGASIPQRDLARIASAYGAGRICWIRSITQTERPFAVARYVADHLVGWSHVDQAKCGRRVRYSRHFWGELTTADIRNQLWPPDPNDDGITWELEMNDLNGRHRLDGATAGGEVIGSG